MDDTNTARRTETGNALRDLRETAFSVEEVGRAGRWLDHLTAQDIKLCLGIGFARLAADVIAARDAGAGLTVVGFIDAQRLRSWASWRL